MSGPDMGDDDVRAHHHQTAVVFMTVPRKPKGEDEYPSVGVGFRRKQRVQPAFDVALREHVSFEKKRIDETKEGTTVASLMSSEEDKAWRYSIETSLLSAGQFQNDVERVYSKLRDLLEAHRILLKQYLNASKGKRAARAKEAIQGWNALEIAGNLADVISGLHPRASTHLGRTKLSGRSGIRRYIHKGWVEHNKESLKYLDNARAMLAGRDDDDEKLTGMSYSHVLRQAEEFGNKLNELVRNRRIPK